VLTGFLNYNPAKNLNPFLQLMVRHIHQLYPQVINICQILELIAKSLIYHYRLNNDDDLKNVAQDLRRYLKTLTIKKKGFLTERTS
jgi:hypothetical protein